MLKGVIQTAYHSSKASKESSGKDEGSTDEVYQRKDKGTNRQGERKYKNYIQNQTKVKERLRTRSIKKWINQEINYQQLKIHQIWGNKEKWNTKSLERHNMPNMW